MNWQDMLILKRCMKTSLRTVLAAAFLIFPPGAEAAVWSSIVSNEQMRAEVDIASLLRQGNIVTAWDREVYAVLEQARPGDFYFKSAKSLMRYNCSSRTADLLMKVYYAEDGSEITTITASYYGKPNYVIPDTEGEKKFEHACQYKKPEEKKLVTVTRKKSEKSKETDKTAVMSAKKVLSGDKAKAAAPENPVKPPPRSLPILKPSGTLPKPVADAGKG
ncbi:MAG: hypothetical protein KJ958_00305 [Gammaproteobacteria bacterium]|nr:hypothetical protein [Gammaproteobacteria bacterium]MBU1977589.1 hypothetical protein [Gammaproteobacteria bacterium]